MRNLYIPARRFGRSLLLRYPTLDQRIGRALVSVDLWLRSHGALGSELNSGVIQFEGLHVHFDPDEPDEAGAILTNGTYESETIDVIKQRLHSGSVYVDMGCHIGLLSMIAAQHVGSDGRVYAFEPTPSVRALAAQNFAANKLESRICLEPLAVGAVDGDVWLRIVEGASQANSVVEAGPTLDSILVPMTTMDTYFGRLNWPAVDLVKMDIEGQELAAIRGMASMVDHNPQMVLVFEYHRAQMTKAGTTPEALFKALKDVGFDCFTALYRGRVPLSIPSDLPRLEKMALRSNLNIVAERHGLGSR